MVSDKFYVMLETLTTGADATVSATFPVAGVDSHLLFEPAEAHVPTGVEVLAACSETYKLVLSRQIWSLSPGGELKPFPVGTGGMTLRIVDFPKYVVLDLSWTCATKRWTPRPKQNARKTLATLKKLKE